MTETQAAYSLKNLTEKTISELAADDKRFLVSEVRTQCLQGTIGGVFGLAIGVLTVESGTLRSDLPQLAVNAGEFILWTSQLVLVASMACALWPKPLFRAKVEHRALCHQPHLYPAYRRKVFRRFCAFALFFLAYTVLGHWLFG